MKIITGFVAFMLIPSMVYADQDSTNKQGLFDTPVPHQEKVDDCPHQYKTKDGTCVIPDPVCPDPMHTTTKGENDKHDDHPCRSNTEST